jgi:transposase
MLPNLFHQPPIKLRIDAEMVNRFQLGRTLEDASAYGGDLLLQELALAICAQEGIELRLHHLETTSVALTGEYVPERDEHAMRLTHGSSKDHRPDLKQAGWELLGSQDGGVPFVRKSRDGHASDTQVCQQRAEALLRAFKETPTPRSRVAEATFSWEDQAVHRAKLGFITRLPATLTLGSQGIGQALQWDT